MYYQKLTRSVLSILITIMVSSCEKKPTKKLPVKKTSFSLSQLAEKVLFNPNEVKDYQSVLRYFQTVNENTLTGEETVLKGLAHIYQGEVYEVAAQMLSRMQLDLYYKSTDPAHGSKFPITREIDDIKDELTFWMGVDAYTVYGEKEGKSLLSSTMADPLYKIKHEVIKALSDNSSNYKNQTFLTIYNNPVDLSKKLPTIEKILEAERLFKGQEYEKVLSFLDKGGLFASNIFHSHKQVVYYSPAVFKLAALTHYRLGINVLENSLQRALTTADSKGYRIIAIMNLGQKYHYFDDTGKLSALWDDYREFLATEGSTVRRLVETHAKRAYCLDWIRFEDAILTVLKDSLPKELVLLDDQSDPLLETMKEFIVNPNEFSLHNDIHYVLLDFKRNPDRMDDYPTLMSGFIKELNQSSLSYTEKKLIQDVTENLVFNFKHSKSSWHRNQPAFLLSLYGALRWHGGRLPDLNNFLIGMRKTNERLSSLQEIAALFTQELIK